MEKVTYETVMDDIKRLLPSGYDYGELSVHDQYYMEGYIAAISQFIDEKENALDYMGIGEDNEYQTIIDQIQKEIALEAFSDMATIMIINAKELVVYCLEKDAE